jgi:hypothetical protein
MVIDYNHREYSHGEHSHGEQSDSEHSHSTHIVIVSMAEAERACSVCRRSSRSAWWFVALALRALAPFCSDRCLSLSLCRACTRSTAARRATWLGLGLGLGSRVRVRVRVRLQS